MTGRAPAGVLLPLASEELAKVDEAAERAGLTRHQWIRAVLLRRTATVCAFCRGTGWMGFSVPESRTREHSTLRSKIRCPRSCPIPRRAQ